MLCKLIFFVLEVLFSVCNNTFTGQQWFRLALEVNIQTLIHLLLCLLHSCILAQPLLCFPGLQLLLSVRFLPVGFCITVSCKPHPPQ